MALKALGSRLSSKSNFSYPTVVACCVYDFCAVSEITFDDHYHMLCSNFCSHSMISLFPLSLVREAGDNKVRGMRLVQ